MRIRTQCRGCGLPFRAEIAPSSGDLACPNCGASRTVATEGWRDAAPGQPGTIEVCPLCDCRHLYGQRDINRALGCGLVLIGAALVPWTFGLSLLAFGLLDLWMYRRLPLVPVCYRCDTVYRDARPLPRQGEFELLKHDVLKYGKTWDDTTGRHEEAGSGLSPDEATTAIGARADAGDGNTPENTV